jgi:hypothetical protein
VQIVLAAGDCRKKYQNRKKKGPPQTKGLKIKTHMARNGEDPIVSEAHGIYFSLRTVLRKEHRWLVGRALFSVFPTSVYILGFKFAWILTLMFSKKAVSAAMLSLFLFVSVCLCLCACSCSLERGVVFLM